MGLTQETVARRLGVSHQQIHKYEAGVSRFSISVVSELAKALSVPLSYFFEPSVGPPASEEEARLHRAFKRVRSPSLRTALVNLVESMAEVSGGAGGG